MNMKNMIQRMTEIEDTKKDQLNESIIECGDMPPAPMEMDRGNPVSINVSMNASGKDHVEDLLNMMKKAGLGDAKPAADAMLPMRMDMERLRGMMDEPKKDGKLDLDIDGNHQPDLDTEELGEDDDPEMMSKLQKIADGPDGEDELLMRMEQGMGEEGMYLRKTYDKVSNKMFSKDSGDLEDPEDFDKVHAEVMQMFGIKAEPLASLQQKAKDRTTSDALNDPELTGTEKEGYDNEPEEDYKDTEYMTKDLSGGINREKKAYKAAQRGDNAMAVESLYNDLMAQYKSMK